MAKQERLVTKAPLLKGPLRGLLKAPLIPATSPALGSSTSPSHPLTHRVLEDLYSGFGWLGFPDCIDPR